MKQILCVLVACFIITNSNVLKTPFVFPSFESQHHALGHEHYPVIPSLRQKLKSHGEPVWRQEKISDMGVRISESNEERFSRQLLVYGLVGQAKIASSHIIIVIGSSCGNSRRSSSSLTKELIKNLCLMGIGKLTLLGGGEESSLVSYVRDLNKDVDVTQINMSPTRADSYPTVQSTVPAAIVKDPRPLNMCNNPLHVLSDIANQHDIHPGSGSGLVLICCDCSASDTASYNSAWRALQLRPLVRHHQPTSLDSTDSTDNRGSRVSTDSTDNRGSRDSTDSRDERILLAAAAASASAKVFLAGNVVGVSGFVFRDSGSGPIPDSQGQAARAGDAQPKADAEAKVCISVKKHNLSDSDVISTTFFFVCLTVNLFVCLCV